MRKGDQLVRLCVLMIMIMVVGQAGNAWAGRRHHRSHRSYYRPGPSNLEIVLEGGMASPTGDVSDPLDFSGVGKNAGTGYELGLRIRQYMGGRVAISPAFHYVEFSKTSGIADFDLGNDLGYEVKTSLMSYGVDFQMFLGSPRRRGLTTYVSGGLALIHNRYRDILADLGPYDASANTPGVSVGAGLRSGNFELSTAYTFNRFTSDQMASVPGDLDYNWDYFTVRFGLAFGGI